MAWRNDKVVSAERYERPKQGGGGPFEHAGVVVHTDKSQSFLIHNTSGSGVVATPAENMSSQWHKTGDVEVNGHKTVGDAMKGGYTPGTSMLGNKGEYVGSGLCIGTALGVTNALKK